jgi:hypothetical protein
MEAARCLTPTAGPCHQTGCCQASKNQVGQQQQPRSCGIPVKTACALSFTSQFLSSPLTHWHAHFHSSSSAQAAPQFRSHNPAHSLVAIISLELPQHIIPHPQSRQSRSYLHRSKRHRPQLEACSLSPFARASAFASRCPLVCTRHGGGGGAPLLHGLFRAACNTRRSHAVESYGWGQRHFTCSA